MAKQRQDLTTEHEESEDEEAQRKRKESEIQLKNLLKEHHGSTKNADVQKAIQQLTPFNPTKEPTKSPLLSGDFVCHSLPEFPGRIKTSSPDLIQYTLGRISFGVFQPHNLVCTVRSVRQCIRVRLESKSGVFKTYQYPVMMDITIHAPNGDLPAIVSHDAVCYECPKQPHRLKVTFKGSTLMPTSNVLSDPALLEVWNKTFIGAYAKADKERHLLSKALKSMIKWWFQMELPTDKDAETSEDHSMRFQIKRAPRGYLDVLYMSDTARITRGNRGTLVVVEPMTCSSSA